MNKKIHPVSQSAEPILTDHEYDTQQADQARLMAEFTRLYQQYRRAGYECYGQMLQSDSTQGISNTTNPPEPINSKHHPDKH